MKKTTIFTLLIFTLLIAYSQELFQLHIFEKGKVETTLLDYSEIDSITTLTNDTISQQLFYTQDSLYIYNVNDIDSIIVLSIDNTPFIKYLADDTIYMPKNSRYFLFEVLNSKNFEYEIRLDSSSNWLSFGGGSWGENSRSSMILANEKPIEDPDEDQTAYLYIDTQNGTDTITILRFNKYASEHPIFLRPKNKGIKTHTWQKTVHEIKANDPFRFSGLDLSYDITGEISEECNWIKYNISDDRKTLYLEIDENTDSVTRNRRIIPILHPSVRINEARIIQHKFGTATPEMQKNALIDLYNSMGGTNWENNENWLTDKPLEKWSGLEVGITDDIMSLNITEASGEFPASLASIMDVADYIHISGSWNYWTRTHSLQGEKIPKEITEHPRWDEFGWEILVNNRQAGNGIDMDGINLRMKDEPVMFPDSTTSTAYEVLSRNKYSLISVGMPTDEMANVFLSYRNKGFGYIHAAQDWLGGTIEELRETAKDYPLDIIYTFNSFQLPGMGQLGSTYILDSIGNVIDFEGHIWDYPSGETQNSYYANRIDSILHNLLGEPEPHDPFVSTYYTSTDYSRDGEVLTLQEATVGNGIDLVFMGDAYDDRDMAEGGLYEKDMRKSMEYFFEVEPYKSFRDRFNVYAVKVVSPNSHIGGYGCTQAINYSNDVCFNYASKIDGIDLNQVTIVNVVNNPNSFFISGYTNMYESGASVAHIEQGGASIIIVHEAGGHGFAKLLDEYIYDGYEDNYCPPENLESFKQWIKTDYHNRGWGVNVDATNAPDSVVWSHFLQDSRYADEVGIYQGAWYWPTDLWRASENSVMNNDYSHFNAPSREAIYKRIMQLSEGDDWVYNYETFVEWDQAHQSSNDGETDNPNNPDNPDYLETFAIDGISYGVISEGKVKIIGNDGSLSGVVEVKSTITDADGDVYNVTEIGTGAFANCPNLMTLDIHENIELFEEGYLDGNTQNLTIIMRSTNPPQFADPYYGFYKGYWTLKIPMSAYSLYEERGWTGELQVTDINDNSSTPDDEPTTGANVWTCYYNDTNWGNSTVYAYVWDAGNNNKEYLGSWAGTPMTKNADGVWEITFSTNDSLVTPMVIFSNGNSGNPNQTADLEFINNGIYNFDGYIKNIESSVSQNSVRMQSTEKPVVVRRSEKHRMPTIIKGSPLNPQGAVPLPDFINKTK